MAEDDINIFEEFYESVKPGGTFDQRALDFGKAVTDVLTPNEQTQAEMDAYNQQRQDALNLMFQASGVDPKSFEGRNLADRFRRDRDLQQLLGFKKDLGKELKYDFAKAGQFIFGDANEGLTTMKEQGTKFKELPFNQKFGIVMLPIDALDVIGIGALAKGGLSPLVKAGMKKYGAKSGKTIQDLVNDEDLVQAMMQQNPSFLDELDDALGGGYIQKRYMTGKPKGTTGEKKGPVGLTGENLDDAKQSVKKQTAEKIKAEEIRKTAEGIKGFTGETPTGPKVRPLYLDVGEYKQPLLNLKRSIELAPDSEATVKLFVDNVQKGLGGQPTKVQNQIKNSIGVDQYNKLMDQAVEMGLLKNRLNIAPKGKILTPDGEDFLKENYTSMTRDEILSALRSDKTKYFYTDTAGNFKDLKDDQFTKFSNRLGLSGAKKIPPKARMKLDEIMEQFEKKLNEIEETGTPITEKIRKQEFEFAVRKAEGLQNQPFTDIQTIINNRRLKYNELNPDNPILTQRELFQMSGDGKPGRKEFARKFYSIFGKSDQKKQALENLGVTLGQDVNRNSGTLDRFFDFIRESTPEYKAVNLADEKSLQEFITSMGPRINELADKNSIFRKNYDYFKVVDDARIEMSGLTRPFLDRLFAAPEFKTITKKDGTKIDVKRTEKELIKDAKRSLQIAHRYEGKQIGQTLPKDLAGASEFPQSYTIDVSFINQAVQPSLEGYAREAIRKMKKGEIDEDEFRIINDTAERLGTAFEVDGIQFGTQKGIADKLEQYLQYIVRRPDKQKEFGITKDMMLNMREAINKARSLNSAGYNFAEGGLVGDVDDIFEEEDEIMKARKSIFPRISVEFGDAARGTMRPLKEDEALDTVDLPLSAVQFEGGPEVRAEDVQPTENIFTGEVEQANLKFPFYKLFTKPPVNETAPIPTPKDSLDNPTKKQKESLELEKEKKKDEAPYDPTPDDDVLLTDDVLGMNIAVTPKSQTPITGVFYSDIERLLSRPDTPEIFVNKKALLDFFKKNRIRDSEFRDYQIDSLLKAYDENTPIPKDQVINHLRQSPIRGMHVHATGEGSEIINPDGAVQTQFTGYVADGFLPGSQRERVLYIPNKNIAGDVGKYPQTIFKGEKIENHRWGMRNQDDVYVVGWTRLSDRQAILPAKLGAPKTQSKVPGLTRERERAQRQVAGLYAEAINKLNREGVRRGFSQGDLDELSQLSLEQIQSEYANTLNRLSPGLLDQMDELIVKVRDLDAEIAKGSSVDTSGIVKVTFADEIQSDIMQAAAGRKQKLLATLKRIRDEGADSSTLPNLDKVGNDALAFFEENKSVFRPLLKSEAELEVIGQRLSKVDDEIDEIINRYIETREIDDEVIDRLQKTLETNINDMIEQLITVDNKTYDGLFPDLPFKKREEWADALIKKDLFELAYRKFILKDKNVADYYAVSPEELVLERYTFKGNSATPLDIRAADKKRQIDYFMGRGEFTDSQYKGVGMSEFYGGPNAKDPNGKHYTSTIEKILKTQAKQNNSEFVVLNVQTKEGSKDVYRITDQNGNMVATLSNRQQAERVAENNPNYRIQTIRVPDQKSTTPSFAIKITEEMLEPYKTHKAKGGLVSIIDIFEVN